MRPRQASRWKEDWEELELLVRILPIVNYSPRSVTKCVPAQGKGAFGSVVKAKNKIDGRIYAVKKIRLRTMQRDTKIFREVNALSRLSHRFVVRYYTTWVETSEIASAVASDESGMEDEDKLTSVPGSAGGFTNGNESHFHTNGGFSIDLSELDSISRSHSRSSFPSIHFSRSMSPESGESSGSGSGGSEGIKGDRSGSSSEENEHPSHLNSLLKSMGATKPQGLMMPPLMTTRTLYIQMVSDHPKISS